MAFRIDRFFFELLQVAIGNRDSLSGVPTAEEWDQLYEVAKKQTMVGIAFKGIERIPEEQLPPRPRVRIRQWYVKADKLRKKNENLNLECAKTCFLLAQRGLQTCIIKGQANLRNYGPPKSPLKGDLDRPPESPLKGDLDCSKELGDKLRGLEGLGYYRTPGDIDVWAWSKSGKVKDVILMVKGVRKKAVPYYHHVDCPVVGKTETEIHYRPSWMSAPWRNRTLQEFCNSHKGDVERYPVFLADGRKTFFFVPSIEFDAVYQLVHIYRHLFYEGIGLRQMLDYYMVLMRLGDEQRRSTYEWLERLGMRTFVAATMYVMQEVFGMRDEYLLCAPNGDEGAFLLREIVLAGNFGHEDERINVTKDHWFRWGIMKLRRNMRFLRSYPEEVVCEPFFRVFHWAWRFFELWRW